MQPTIEEMIDRIYEVIADKTLSFGCKIQINYNGEYIGEGGQECYSEKSEILYMGNNGETIEDDWNLHYDIIKNTNQDGWNEDAEIYINVIGHPVMIGDVFDWCMVELGNLRHYWETNKVDDNFRKLLWLRDDFRKPIKKQSDDCITFIYNLVKDATHATSSTINGV